MAKTDEVAGGEPVIIKKYANRRLYNTRTSKYITLDYLADLTRKDVEFKVVDAKTGEDITHGVLTQIIMDEESSGQSMLPVGFLRQLISMYGDSMQATVPQFLEASMDAFRRNQRQFQEAIEGAITTGPFGEIARQNLKFMAAAREAFTPPIVRGATPSSAAEPASAPTSELDDLKAEMAALQARMDRIAKDG